MAEPTVPGGSGTHPTGSIMVAFVATAGGREALRLGIAIARARGLALKVVMALQSDETCPGTYPHDRGYAGLVEEQAARWLADALDEVPPDISATAHIAVGDSVTHTLLGEARRLDCQLMVVGARGGGLLNRLSLGSVVDTLLHSSPIPVALAPRGFDHPGPVERITAMFGPRPGAADTVAVGASRARLRGIPLRLVNLEIGGEKPLGEPAIAAATKAATELLRSGQADRRVVTAATVEEAMGRLDWRPGEVALIGSSRLAPDRRLFVGATALKILRHTPVPVVAIPRGFAHFTGFADSSSAEEEANRS